MLSSLVKEEEEEEEEDEDEEYEDVLLLPMSSEPVLFLLAQSGGLPASGMSVRSVRDTVKKTSQSLANTRYRVLQGLQTHSCTQQCQVIVGQRRQKKK